MKKLLVALTLMMSVFTFAVPASAVTPATGCAASPNMCLGGGPQPLVAAGLVVGAIYLAYTDKVQACDSLPEKAYTAPGGGYSYTDAGCETVGK